MIIDLCESRNPTQIYRYKFIFHLHNNSIVQSSNVINKV